jgi:hypothetical protein
MLLRSCKNLMRLDRLRRGVAIFLLVFAFFDMAIVDVFFPQACGEQQMSTHSAGPVDSIEEGAGESMAVKNRDSQPGQDSHESYVDEDCFCCCSHIIPSPHVNVGALNFPPQAGDPSITSLPSAPPRGAYHPPRLS